MASPLRYLAIASSALALLLSACGGGGSSAPSASSISGASPGATSSGTVTAFGSVFVNGHEFKTTGAKVFDDDDPTVVNGTSSLEVGMSVDLRASPQSSQSHPEASEIHVHPLVRGIVDGSDQGSSTLTVMGQTVQLSASTIFSDHRACVSATSSPCTPITGQSGLSVTNGSGSGATPGSYVTVYGFLFAASSSAGANVVATLVSVADTPASASHVAYKAEGVVNAVGTNSITIGALTIDVSSAVCRAGGAPTPCGSAFSIGQVVSAIGAKAPGLPASAFVADAAFLRSRIAVETPGATVEVEGKVSSVVTSPASFVVRGFTVDASALSSLPAVGDLVVVTGTVSSDGTAVVASDVKVIHAAKAATYGFEGDVTSVVPGGSADTFVMTLLGQTITVDSSTRLLDLSTHNDPTVNPFNISTFQTYLAASASQHVIARTRAGSAGNLTATSVIIVPASATSAVSGHVDATPAPVNGTGSSAPTTFAVHGVAVSADPAAVVGMVSQRDAYGFGGMGRQIGATVSAGDLVLVFGAYATGTLTVTAPASPKNVVLDFGAGSGDRDRDCF
ncbi:MAG TPA: DUF5666 domain-containing protein [Burkholderiaceae bacterium]|nr:DUF5666 domain-containing protein [Burkholderiaceae bacterium]